MPTMTHSWKQKFIAKNGPCVWCGTGDDLSIDHIYARVLGGKNTRSNFQVLCHSCNCKKAFIEQQIALERDPYREIRGSRNANKKPLSMLSIYELDEIYRRILQSSPTQSKSHKQKYMHRHDRNRICLLQELNKRIFMEY